MQNIMSKKIFTILRRKKCVYLNICICYSGIDNTMIPVMLEPGTSRSPVELLNTELHFNLYVIETPFNTFAYRADPDQAALVRAA